jgi:O-antigen/teichoic acid export membrane protein
MNGIDAGRWLAKSAGGGAIVRALGLAIGLAVSIFLARTLGATDLGVYQGILSVGLICASLAAATAAIPSSRRIAALDDKESPQLPREVVRAHLVVGIAVVALVVALLVLSLIPGLTENVRVTLRLSALVTPGMAILSLRQWIALPLQGVASSIFPEQVSQPLVFLGVAGIVAYRAGLAPVEALVIYAVVCWVVWVVASMRSGLLRLLRVGLGQQPFVPSLRRNFHEGRHFVLLAAGGVLPVYATIPITAALMNPTDAGLLAVGLQLTGLISIPLQILSLAIMPECVRMFRDGDTGGLNTLVRTACSVSFAAAVLIAALLLGLLDTILGVFGPSFASASTIVPVPVLALGQVVNATLGPNGPTLQMVGAEREVGIIETVVTVVRLSAVALAAIGGSILWVAIAIAATTILRNLLLSAVLYRKTAILTLPQLPLSRGRRR